MIRPRLTTRCTGLLLLLSWLLLMGSCAGFPWGEPRGPRTHALLLNGGGEPASNYASHVEHLRGVLAVLEDSGIRRADIAVFASDGPDPAADLAIARARPDSGEFLTHKRNRGPSIRYINTEIEGVEIHPASRAALAQWFEDEASEFRAGDRLLIYVTDHGTRGKEGPLSNRISLWDGEHVSAAELGDWIDEVPRGVQVVMWMSQCFSGGFAELAQEDPDGSRCGYFSTTAERLAYGCYAEVSGNVGVGHSMRFLDGLQAGASFGEAHQFTQVNDHTPDVPLRTTDVYRRRLLEQEAARRDLAFDVLVDTLLLEAWQDPQRFEEELRLLDRIGRSFGFAGTRSLVEVRERMRAFPEVNAKLSEHSKAWRAARKDAEEALYVRFAEAMPDLHAKMEGEYLRKLPRKQRKELKGMFRATFDQWVQGQPEVIERLDSLRRREARAGAIEYRMEVRHAALERLELVLLEVAVQVLLEQDPAKPAAAGLASLQACEDFSLELPRLALPEDRPPFPSYDSDIAAARQVLPGYMGIQFRQARPEVREEYGLESGAVRVRYVYEGSPAAAAGLLLGDIVVGPPDEAFTEPRQIREWTMFQEAGVARPLEILRDGEPLTIELVPGEHPGRFPELPQPPAPGDPAPPLSLESVRGDLPATLVGEGPHLVFFWATWCAPCKASLPALMDWAAREGVPVIAVSDEEASVQEAFLEQYEGPFPAIVARDPLRAAHIAWGVSGTPTFVLVDETGAVLAHHTGYSAKNGLSLPQLR